MDDIVERLQSHINLRMGATALSAGPDDCSVTMADARDEIEDLRAALSQARNHALEEAANLALTKATDMQIEVRRPDYKPAVALIDIAAAIRALKTSDKSEENR